jgi:hypothetical protein
LVGYRIGIQTRALLGWLAGPARWALAGKRFLYFFMLLILFLFSVLLFWILIWFSILFCKNSRLGLHINTIHTLLVQYVVLGRSLCVLHTIDFLNVVMVFVRGLNRNDFLKILFLCFFSRGYNTIFVSEWKENYYL